MSAHKDHGQDLEALAMSPARTNYSGGSGKPRRVPNPAAFTPGDKLHPLQVVKIIADKFAKNSPGVKLVFSMKIMRNDIDTEGGYGILSHDKKDFFRFKAEDLDKPDFASDTLKAAYDEGTDIALMSSVRVNDNGKSTIMHIPFIDFACRPFTNDDPEEKFPEPVEYYFQSHMEGFFEFEKEDQGNWLFFDSGRAFHGYGTFLMSEEEYTGHLAKLLLLNRAVGLPLVDTRWIGHVLFHLNAGLRLTANSRYYKKVPTLIQNPFLG